ncbi:MAG: MmgE/PrpD family protein [Rhodospirillales bacterium]|nr:MmgE/PrpD family protein [Rhodospirillales bacterium]
MSDLLDTLAAYAMRNAPLAAATTRTASLALLDALACLAASLADPPPLLGPWFAGANDAAFVPGCDDRQDPIKTAFDISLLIRWQDFSDTSLLGGHPSDNLGAILAVAAHRARMCRRAGMAGPRMDDVFRAMRTAYEIQGCLAINRLDAPAVGLDHVAYVRLASAAVATVLLGGDAGQVRAALSHAVLDGGSLNAYRHPPNIGPRKGWAGADATSRGVLLAAMAMKGEAGTADPLGAAIWGFEAVHLNGTRLRLGRDPGDYFLDRVIFKLAPCQRNGSTAVEAAMRLHPWFKAHGFAAARIDLLTQDEAMARIVRDGPLANPAARDHCLQYMVAVALLHGRLDVTAYDDATAADPRIDRLRTCMTVRESAAFSAAHHDPAIASCANALRITAADGAVSPLVEIAYPIGDPSRRAEAMPMLEAKFRTLSATLWNGVQQDTILTLFADPTRLAELGVAEFMDAIAVP